MALESVVDSPVGNIPNLEYPKSSYVERPKIMVTITIVNIRVRGLTRMTLSSAAVASSLLSGLKHTAQIHISSVLTVGS